MPRPKAYLIPGLGLDERIFGNLQLPDYEVQCIQWLQPHALNEPIQSYAWRMVKEINEKQEEVVLIGHSFGGMMAQEMARSFPVRKIILVSSIKLENENNPVYRLAGRLGLYHFIHKTMVTRMAFRWFLMNGVGNAGEKQLVDQMYRDNSKIYLQWASRQVATWKSVSLSTPIVHIHGTEDRTFPFYRIHQPVISIEGGRHFMVYQRAAEIGALIREEIGG